MAEITEKLNLVVLTFDRTVYEGLVDSVTALGVGGEFTVLPRHVAFMTPLEVGVLNVRVNGKQENIAIHSGFMRVEDDGVTVLADAAEMPQEIDIERARAAKKRAEDRLRQTGSGGIDVDRARAGLRRALLRLRIAGQ